MAAINLTAANTSPWEYSHVFSGGNVWQEFTLPGWCRVVVVISETTDVYIGAKGAGTPGSPTPPVDGGAVGAHRIKIPSSSAFEWVRGPIQNENMLFVAAGAAGTVTLHMEP